MSEPTANASQLGVLASAVQAAVASRGPPSEKLASARHDIQPLSADYDTKLYAWVRERQVASLHAWACVLGLDLTLRAHSSHTDFLAAIPPLSAQMVLGLDLDPASTDDLRKVVSQSLASDGFIVAGIQQTETPPAPPPPQDGSPPPPPPPPPRPAHTHGGHDHGGLKGNAYNFASSPQHAASFDLTQGQLSDLPCFRADPAAPLGCVEASHNWFATGCELGAHLGHAPVLANALLEFTAGWPVGGRLAEKCVGQRHFMGYRGTGYRAGSGVAGGGEEVEGAGGSTVDNTRNPYFVRALMGFCMFHSCKEVRTPWAGAAPHLYAFEHAACSTCMLFMLHVACCMFMLHVAAVARAAGCCTRPSPAPHALAPRLTFAHSPDLARWGTCTLSTCLHMEWPTACTTTTRLRHGSSYEALQLDCGAGCGAHRLRGPGCVAQAAGPRLQGPGCRPRREEPVGSCARSWHESGGMRAPALGGRGGRKRLLHGCNAAFTPARLVRGALL